MHSLIVALLCLTLCVDTAKACWWRRHQTTVRSSSPAFPQQLRAIPIDTHVCCLPVEDSAEVVVVIDHHGHALFDGAGCDPEVVVSADLESEWVHERVETSAGPAQVVHGHDEVSAVEPPATAPETVVVHGPTFVVEAAPATPPPAPEPASAVAAQPMPVQAAGPAVLPDPMVTEEPLPNLLPATAGPEEQATTPALREPNLFDLYDDTAGNAASDDPALPADEAATEEPEETPPASTEAAPEAVFFIPDEPMRRWTNEAGTHQAQGWLVELRADRVRILKVNGRHTTVARESLSAEDRAYVSAVSDRLAAGLQSTVTTTATAGL